tara:strand:+ start:1177 stop:1410 length:234 start_codon:yes stop_codon:yes gene_type:complete
MKKLDVLFSARTQSKITSVINYSEVNISKSEVARAAMEIGLNLLSEYDETQQEAFFSIGEYISIMSKRSMEDIKNVG